MNGKNIIWFAALCLCALAGCGEMKTEKDCGDSCAIPLLPGQIETLPTPAQQPAPAPAVASAPQLAVAEWIQGPEVQVATGQVTVVEFWATWCPPCVFTIPHLNKLHNDYKDKGLKIAALSFEKPETVRAFVEKKGEDMAYPVAISSRGDFTNYFGERESVGIPHAFVIGKNGAVVWEGNPGDSAFGKSVKDALGAD